MKTPIVWTPPARSHLADLHDYVSESSTFGAIDQALAIAEAINTLSGFPEMGRPGRRRGTRELVVTGTPYIVAYRVRKGAIEILAIVHGARRWPRSFAG
jgi:toxin ParE1/3/4